MNLINLGHFLWLIRATLKDKVLDSKFDIVHRLVMESAIQVFLLICIIFWMNENEDFLSSSTSLIFQMICIFSVCLSLIYELATLIVNILTSNSFIN